MDKKKIFSIVAILLIAVTSIILRVMYVNSALWYDEACSWFSAKQNFPFGIMDNLLNTDLQHTPLYFFLLHFWMKIFGNTEISLKSLSLVFSILALPLAYSVTKKLTQNKLLSMFVFLITCVSPTLVYFSTEVRMYPMIMFLVMLSINYLIDYEQKKDTKSLTKLITTNILIPYTFVGAIFYNISLMFFYSKHIKINNKDLFDKYKKGMLTEILFLIPYLLLIFYYAKQRLSFVIKHEGVLEFASIVETVRNFFGANTVANMYWTNPSPELITLSLTIFVILPCVYFVWGFLKEYKICEGIQKVICNVILTCFAFSVITAFFQINVFTLRYVLYLLMPLLILSVIGLHKTLHYKHFIAFVILFLCSATVFNIKDYKRNIELKALAFKSVQTETKALNMTTEDIVILPFGADAPYYFKKLSEPQIFDFDFHKQARNPKNENLYSTEQIQSFKQNGKYKTVFEIIKQNNSPSENFINYFKANVSNKVEPGRYAIIALYGSDSSSLINDWAKYQQTVNSVKDAKNRIVELLFVKYLYDLRLCLEQDFNLITSYKKDNFTYIIYQKR